MQLLIMQLQIPNCVMGIAGTTIMLPLSILHFLPEYYPDPERFEPARWLASTITDAGTYLSVIHAPSLDWMCGRACAGKH